MNKVTRCGYIAIVGRPNVGKSTLLNRILGKKISITSPRPQTTRHKILGVKTSDDCQFIYLDTPGLQHKERRKMNEYMNQTVLDALHEADVIIFMVSALDWRELDDNVLGKLSGIKCPVILAINKVDQIADKRLLLEYIKNVSEKLSFTEVVPISATDGTNVQALEDVIKELLPKSPLFFPAEQFTDRSKQFLAAEIIREKLTRLLGAELPYAIFVAIDKFALENNVLHISATIFVERTSQKAIVIGAGGVHLKKIATLARQDLEKLFAEKVFLQVWVKVKSNWADDERFLQSHL